MKRKFEEPIPTFSRYEYSKEEWWGMCKQVKPELTWDEFCDLWGEFCEYKRLKTLH